MRYQIHRWQVEDQTVFARDGLVRIAWRITPTGRIQAVHVRRDPLELLLGLSSVIVSTASSNGPVAVVGLDRHRATVVANRARATRSSYAGGGDMTAISRRPGHGI